MLTLSGFAKQYLYGARLFGGVDAEFRDGETVAVYGGEGSGKTSFLKTICGAERAEGEVLLDGERIERRTDKVIMVFDDGAVFRTRTVFDNLAYPLKLRGMERAEIASRVVAAAEETGIGGCLNVRAGRLTPAERRRMSLARLIVRPARLCLIDEPTAGLSREDAREVFRDFFSIVRRLRAEGTTVIFSTSSREETEIADRIVVLVSGEVKQIASLQDIAKAPESVWAAQAVDEHYNVAKAVLCDENGVLKLVFGENDEIEAECLRGRIAEEYIGKEVLAGWFPDAAAEGGATAPAAYVLHRANGFVMCAEEGFAEFSVRRKESVSLRPDVARVTLFDRTNEFSIMRESGV